MRQQILPAVIDCNRQKSATSATPREQGAVEPRGQRLAALVEQPANSVISGERGVPRQERRRESSAHPTKRDVGGHLDDRASRCTDMPAPPSQSPAYRAGETARSAAGAGSARRNGCRRHKILASSCYGPSAPLAALRQLLPTQQEQRDKPRQRVLPASSRGGVVGSRRGSRRGAVLATCRSPKSEAKRPVAAARGRSPSDDAPGCGRSGAVARSHRASSQRSCFDVLGAQAHAFMPKTTSWPRHTTTRFPEEAEGGGGGGLSLHWPGA